MVFLIIYITGFVVNYYIYRRHQKRTVGRWGWDDIIIIMIFSLLSWMSVIAFFIEPLLTKLSQKNPPKWL